MQSTIVPEVILKSHTFPKILENSMNKTYCIDLQLQDKQGVLYLRHFPHPC